MPSWRQHAALEACKHGVLGCKSVDLDAGGPFTVDVINVDLKPKPLIRHDVGLPAKIAHVDGQAQNQRRQDERDNNQAKKG